jgi:hypothetical protein
MPTKEKGRFARKKYYTTLEKKLDNNSWKQHEAEFLSSDVFVYLNLDNIFFLKLSPPFIVEIILDL